jgi:mannose-6-phosphate isomerase-like protein (cupin superfamily)
VNHTTVKLGPFDRLDEQSFVHPKFGKVNGKFFLKAPLQLTGMEVSLNKLPPGREMPYHKHERHEELYVFTGGRGQMQVDGQVFLVEEGTVVRVGPQGARAVRNDSPEPLYYMCIQARDGSMTDDETWTDGRPAGRPTWPA